MNNGLKSSRILEVLENGAKYGAKCSEMSQFYKRSKNLENVEI